MTLAKGSGLIRPAGVGEVWLGAARVWPPEGGGSPPPPPPPPGPTFDAFTIHAWDPASGSDASGIIGDAVASVPMYARRGASALASWDGVHTDYQHVMLDEADAQAILTGAARTITFWIRRNASSGNYQFLADYAQDRPDDGGVEGGWTLYYAEASAVFHSARNEFGFGSGSNTATFTSDTWHFVALTLGPSQWRFYLNASLIGDYTWSAAANGDQNRVLKFGPSGPGAYDAYTDTLPTSGSAFAGGFGDIRVHNKILSGTEISALNTAGRLSY